MFGFLIEAWHRVETSVNSLNGEFDSGSERTLAAWIRHASRTVFIEAQVDIKAVANGCVTREQSTFKWGIARRKAN